MAHYLIELRFFGKTKSYLRRLIFEISNKFQVSGVTSKRPVPHISLVGGFTTKDENRLLNTFHQVMKKYRRAYFRISGFGHFRGTGLLNWILRRPKVIFVEINPSDELKDMRRQLVDRLRPFCELKPWDHKPDSHLHATIAFKDINSKFNQIWKFLETKEKPKFKQTVLRVTLLKNGLILSEYDLIQGKLLNRSQAKDKQELRRTFQILKSTSGTQ